MKATFRRQGSWCTDHIRSVHDFYQVAIRELFKVTMHTAHISSNGSHFLTDGSWCTDHKRSVPDFYQVTIRELFMVTTYTENIS